MAARQPYGERATTVGAPATLAMESNLGAYPTTTVEGIVNSSIVTTFSVYGSIDAEAGNWRKTTEINIAAGDVGIDKPFLLDNGYQYMKIETTDVGEHLIEIAGAGGGGG